MPLSLSHSVRLAVLHSRHSPHSAHEQLIAHLQLRTTLAGPTSRVFAAIEYGRACSAFARSRVSGLAILLHFAHSNIRLAPVDFNLTDPTLTRFVSSIVC